jgi:hypothetical protein
LPPGHAHPGWSRLQAQSCFVHDAVKVCAFSVLTQARYRERMSKRMNEEKHWN